MLKDPQGTLFGKNTTGGAINITTKQPELDRVGGYVTGVVGNYDHYDITGVLNLPLVTDKLGIRVLGMHREHGGYGTDFAGRDLASMNQDGGRVNLLWKPSPQVQWRVSGDYTESKGGGPIVRLVSVSPFPSTVAGTPNPAPALVQVAVQSGLLSLAQLGNPAANGAAIGAALATAQQRFAAYADGSYYDVSTGSPSSIFARTYGVSSNLSVDLLPNLTFRSITAARWLKRQATMDLDSSPFAITDITLFSNARNLSQELQFSSQNNKVFDWIVGAYFNEETGNDGSRSIGVAAINPNNPNLIQGAIKNSSWAVFGQTVLKLTDTLRATGGLRWTEEGHRLQSFNRFGPTQTCNIPVSVRAGAQCTAIFNNGFSDYSYLEQFEVARIRGF